MNLNTLICAQETAWEKNLHLGTLEQLVALLGDFAESHWIFLEEEANERLVRNAAEILATLLKKENGQLF